MIFPITSYCDLQTEKLPDGSIFQNSRYVLNLIPSKHVQDLRSINFTRRKWFLLPSHEGAPLSGIAISHRIDYFWWFLLYIPVRKPGYEPDYPSWSSMQSRKLLFCKKKLTSFCLTVLVSIFLFMSDVLHLSSYICLSVSLHDSLLFNRTLYERWAAAAEVMAAHITTEKRNAPKESCLFCLKKCCSVLLLLLLYSPTPTTTLLLLLLRYGFFWCCGAFVGGGRLLQTNFVASHPKLFARHSKEEGIPTTRNELNGTAATLFFRCVTLPSFLPIKRRP